MNKKTAVIIILIVLLLLLGGLTVFLLFHSNPASSEQGKGVNLVIDPNLEDYAQGSGSDKPASDNQISIPGFEQLIFQQGQKKQKVVFGNPVHNNCYFVVSLTLENGEEIYRSGLISPGKSVQEIELTRALKAGTYFTVLTYDTYTLDDSKTPLNGANMNVDIIVK